MHLNKLDILSSVLCYTAYPEDYPDTLEAIYTSIEDAMLDKNLSADCIISAVDRTDRTAGGYFWRTECFYLPDSIKQSNANANLRSSTNRGKHKHLHSSNGVVQINMHSNEPIAYFHSIYEATKATGINNIMNCCKGKAKSAGGYKWKLVSDNETFF